MDSSVYIILSVVLPGVYLSLCMYMRPAVVQINIISVHVANEVHF